MSFIIAITLLLMLNLLEIFVLCPRTRETFATTKIMRYNAKLRIPTNTKLLPSYGLRNSNSRNVKGNSILQCARGFQQVNMNGESF